MQEFELIDAMTRRFGSATRGALLRLGIGDDAAVNALPPGHELVSSIDTLIANTHFPENADAEKVGYRAMMVSLSDLAAMGADPLFVLIALVLPDGDPAWALDFATGAAEAATETGATIAGGNLTRGPLAVSISVHGSVPAGQAVTRKGARPGDCVYVSGHLGGAAAALAAHFTDPLLNARFYRPRARLDLAGALRTHAHAAIDISDGLVQDLGHLMRASGCACDIRSADVPVFTGATLADALYGGDDYELCFTSATPPPFPATRIGVVRTGQGVTVDGRAPARSGYRHFA